jgi:hypothetical protein
MPGKYGSANFGALLVGGYNLLAAKVQSVTYRIEALLTKTDGLGDGWEESTPTGMQKATITQAGAFFDDAQNGIHDAFKAMPDVVRVIALAPVGNAIGALFIGAEGTYAESYDVVATEGGLTKANVTYQVSGRIDQGVVVQPFATKNASWNTKTDGASVDFALAPQLATPIVANTIANPTVVQTAVPHGLSSGDGVLISGVVGSTPTINGAFAVTVIDATHFSVPVNVTVAGAGGSFVRTNTSNGGAGYLEVSGLSGITGFVGTIRSSPDDVTYADLITFANVTVAPAAQRIAVAGRVDQYLSFDGAVTGAGSITLLVGFGRA